MAVGPYSRTPGLLAERRETVSVGSPLTLTVTARDPSERDRDDFRFREPIPLRVVWYRHQGPGEVEFTRHESTPVPEEDDDDDAAGGRGAGAAAAAGGRGGRRPGPEAISLPDGEGVAQVYATFSEPGEYILRARVDNWGASDSSSGSQCCWTNGYVRVSVTS